ncbi:hypothetical protein O7626_40935 [Micromonospora sp. WMMD1102]|uniref:hypothetical protein n=1 Tax=Micromonospora sp. WMMD1102 TaxID=3016105 RepID=UPI002414E348|nr:hypothetical protein [Micromonospora sp. WMMD1102]MDG4785696.1 hypothetical protein [Micromonospora sp. WMMD1102]MDG4792171.1 hypothetical protein [Micromonospora sp. WMMD1102]
MLAMPLRWLGVGTGVAGLAASSLFGGLETVAKAEVPTVEVGQRVDGGPWQVTVTGSRLVGKLPTLYLADGKRWLTVLATIENAANKSRTDFDDAVRLAGVAGVTREQDDGTAVPESVTVQVWGTTRRLDTVGDRWEWLDPERRAEVRVPVQDGMAG